MRWIWRHLAQHMTASMVVELQGITLEELQKELHQEAVRRLNDVEGILFCEEIPEEEKLQTLQQYFLDNCE